MIRLMIGRDLKSLYIPPAAPAGDDGARDRGICAPPPIPTTRSASRCAAGEILGLAGLVGSGRTELARALFGIDRMLGGEIRLDGEPVAIAFAARRDRPRHLPGAGGPQALRAPARRSRSPRTSRCPTSPAYRPRPARQTRRRERENAERQRAALEHQDADRSTTVVGTLSGGNQQKVVLAKWLSMQPKVMIFDEPTRGIDVGAKSEIYELMRELADGGVAILMISSDMEEVIGVSDRIAVMHEGAHQRLSRARPSSARRTCCGSPSARG